MCQRAARRRIKKEFCFFNILKSKNAFPPILFAKYSSQSSQFEQPMKDFSHFSQKSTYHGFISQRT